MVLSQILYFATKRFPNDASLKIHYALFLMENLK